MSDSMTNPFFAPSSLPFSLPPFAEINDAHFVPALDRGMAEHRAEVEEIATNPEPATFDNTVVALERAGQLLDRVGRVFWALTSTDATSAIQAIDETYAPRLAAHGDAIRLDSRLYERIRAVSDGGEDLDRESRRLVDRHLTQMTLAGAGLDEAAKTRLREINERLAALATRFKTDLMAETNELAVIVEDLADLDGLSAGEVSAAAEAARDRGHDGAWLITLVLPTGHPHLASLTNRELRRQIHEAQTSRGSRGGEHDTRGTILQIVRLRAERARLLGYPTHAHAVLADSTAGSPDAVDELLSGLAPAAARNARAEQEALAELAGAPVEAHDWAYWTERVRAERYDVDVAAIRPYFEAERVLHDGVFYAADRLFGLTFHERPDLSGYHPEVRVFEVREEDGTAIGLFLLDLYTRDTKKGGAWMNSFVLQSRLLEQPHAVVCNNLNVLRPAPGEPTLLTYDNVRTLFHEFGHALHGLLARVAYPRFAGTSVYRDFVEFPSQVNEMWMLWPEVLANYARHHETGEPLPQDLVDRLRASASFNEGFATSEYLAAALLDQAWHALDETAAQVRDVEAFEAAALAKVGLDNPAVPPRYRTSYFAHSFSHAYDAQYYSYIWSEVLDADTVAWFEQNGGLTRENGERYRRYIIGIGGSADPLESYREFRGGDADIQHLLTRRGLA